MAKKVNQKIADLDEKKLLKLGHDRGFITQEEILSVLLRGTNGEESGDYLGYRNHRPKVIKYLKGLILRNI